MPGNRYSKMDKSVDRANQEGNYSYLSLIAASECVDIERDAGERMKQTQKETY